MPESRGFTVASLAPLAGIEQVRKMVRTLLQ
jgi:hypothetical protein